MRRFLLTVVVIAAILFAIITVVRFVAVNDCRDRGGRWEDDGCECTREQLADPAVKPEWVAYCKRMQSAPID